MTSPDSPTTSGGCLCGAVRYRVNAPLRNVVNCHCDQCRRTSGHYVAATSAPTSALTLLNDSGLRWYQSSPTARRGFCQTCGSSLFWEPVASDRTAIMAGTLDGHTGLQTDKHIYTDFAGDYYTLDDALPQHSGSD